MSFKGIVRELKEMRDGIGSISRRGIEGRHWRSRTRSHIAPDVALPSQLFDQGQWANLPPELLLDIIRRVEESETSWPARTVVVYCASVCKSWRDITKEIVKTPEECGRLTFPISLKQPGPRDAPIQCYIRRDRATSTHRLYFGLTPWVLVCMLRIITKASLPHSRKGLRTSTHIYFFTSTFIELVCIVCTNILHKLPNIRHYTTKPQLDNQPKNESKPPKTMNVLKKLRWLVMCMVLIYLVTLSIFPGYLSENVKSTLFGDWYPVFLITAFNVGDFSGKCLTALYVVKRSRWVVWGCVARVLFYPLFMGCVFGPKWLRNEAVVSLLTLLLGVSNGYLTSVLMILAPKFVQVEESNIAGIVMSLFLAMGLVIGSGLGWLWNIRT